MRWMANRSSLANHTMTALAATIGYPAGTATNAPSIRLKNKLIN